MFRLAGLSAVAGVVFAAQAAMAGERWDMHMTHADSSHHMQAARLFATAAGACSGGALEIVPRAGNSGGTVGGIKAALRGGRVALGEFPLAAHQHQNALFAVDSLPFLATSFTASDRLYRIARPALEAALARQDLVLLYAVPDGPQGLYGDRQAGRLSDLKGMLLAAPDAMTSRFAELAGMRPTPPGGDGAMQLAPAADGYRRGAGQGLAHFHDIRAWLPRGYVVANRDAYDALSESSRQCLHAGAAQAAALGAARARALAGWYRGRLPDRGVAVHAPDDKLVVGLARIGRILADEWAASAGPEGRAILKAYRAGD